MKIDPSALAVAVVFVLSSALHVQAESKPPTAPAETAPAAAPAATSAAPTVSIEILRMVLTKDVQEREPVGEITTASVGDVVVGWTQVRTEGGEATLSHRWLHEGANLGDVPLTIRSSPWRTWSRKTIHAPGNWTWQVLDPQGAVLKETVFTATAAAAATEPPVPASTPQ